MADKYLNLTGLQYLWNKIQSELSNLDKVDIYEFGSTTYSEVQSTISNDKIKGISLNGNAYPVFRYIVGTNRIDFYILQYSNNAYQIIGLRINSGDTWSYFSVEDIALQSDIPTLTSELTNDSGYITNSVDNLTNYTDTTSMNSLLDNKVSKSGDTMSGELNISKSSGNAWYTSERTDTTLKQAYGVGSAGTMGGVYSFNLSKYLLYEDTSGNVYLNGIDFTTARGASNELIRALQPASANIVDDTPIITGGNTVDTANTAYYRRNASGIKNYILNKITQTSDITSESAITATITPSEKYDSHGVLEKFGRVCTLDVNCAFSTSYANIRIATIPAGYRPRKKHSYNIQTNSGTSNPYITINTNGDVVLGGYTANVGMRAVLTWIVAQ